MSRAADWDAATYQQVSTPHAAWGASVLDRLELKGDEVVLDAGCGTGRVTKQLLERLPAGKVIAADLSAAMLAEAQRTLAPYAAQVTFIQTDLLEIDMHLIEKVDAIFSTATFHWISDHARLFANLHKVLKAQGQLVAQFGGGDNIAGCMAATDAVAARSPYKDTFQGRNLWRFYFYAEETRQKLEAAGFKQVEAWLEPSPQTFSDKQALAEFLRTVILSRHLQELPEHQRDAFLCDVIDENSLRQGGLVLDYVRLNATARA